MQTLVHRWASYFSFDARAPNSDMSDVTLVIWLNSPKTDFVYDHDEPSRYVAQAELSQYSTVLTIAGSNFSATTGQSSHPTQQSYKKQVPMYFPIQRPSVSFVLFICTGITFNYFPCPMPPPPPATRKTPCLISRGHTYSSSISSISNVGASGNRGVILHV